VRIATYNVRNLFTAADACVLGVPARTARENRALVGTIAALGADVLLLQEVGSIEALAAVNDALDAPYPFLEVPESNSSRGIHLGILSREAFELASFGDRLLTDENGATLYEYETEAAAAADAPTPLKIQRDLMRADVQLAGGAELSIFNVHLKSKTNREWRRLAADVIRSAECRLLAEVIEDHLERFPQCATLLVGDFNDTRGSAAVAPLFDLLGDPLGEQLAKTGQNPSTYWPRRRMRLDFILTSATAQLRVVEGSGRIHRSERSRRASDHYPVSVDLD
jgi:endonuclease/exonuclease/phosphatase family metal-dependent hydrolase